MAELSSTAPARSADECARIYRAVFNGPLPPVIAERFAGPSSRLDDISSANDMRRYRHAIARVSDLEALEVAARLTGRLPLLCQKFHLVVYLAETLPDNQHHFIGTRDSFMAGLAAVVAGGFRTAYKLARGLLLMRGVDRA